MFCRSNLFSACFERGVIRLNVVLVASSGSRTVWCATPVGFRDADKNVDIC